ncbi:efflux RND transporter periplasmic adaptor subunit [Oxalobacteraceae bacterium]|nr:efflux RND transporter periplasmic adaptor subunit [Oxalobacteraceae bacterium]
MNRKQTLSIAAIVALSAILAALILGSGRHAPAGEPAHDSHQEDAQVVAGKVALSDAQIRSAAIDVRKAEAATLKDGVQLPGDIRLNEDHTARLVARVAGLVEAVPVSLGQQVKRGQVLAVIASGAVADLRSDWQTAQRRLELARATYQREKKLWEEQISAQQDYLQAEQAWREAGIAERNLREKLAAMGVDGSGAQGLNRFQLKAPFDGVIVERKLNVGETVREDAPVLTISDLGSLWLDVNVPARDLALVRSGSSASISADGATAKASISYVSAALGEQSRTASARIVLANPKGEWRPGQFASVRVEAPEVRAPVTVLRAALQSLDGKTVVYLRVAGGFLAQEVETGRGDGKLIEIVKGVQAGAAYAAAGSFIIKSEQGKSSAEEGH